jgi:hypothetical protein
MRQLVPLLFVFLGCGGNDPSVSISGNDPAGDAEDVADALCEYEQECGSWEISCTTSNGATDCTATKEVVDYNACYAENLPEITEDLMCAGTLSASEADLVERCVNKALAQDCITQAEMDAMLAEIEAGNEPEPVRPTPAECEQLGTIFERCESPRTTSTSPLERAIRIKRVLGR